MRIVLTGSPQRYRRITEADLPADRDLRYSYLRWVDASRLDLSGYDLRDCDFINCRFRGTRFSNLDWTIMRWCDVRGAQFPPDLTSYNHDAVVEVIRQAKPRLRGLPLRTAEIIEAYVAESYWHSWRDAIWQGMQMLGLTTGEEALEAGLPMFEGYPRLQERLHWNIQNGDYGPDPPRGAEATRPIRAFLRGETKEFPAAFALRGFDRWAAARMIERLVLEETGEEVHAHVHQLHPWWAALVVSPEWRPGDFSFGWWRGQWPS